MDNEPPTRVARSNSRAVCARDMWLISACGHPSCACFGATSVHCLRVLPRAVVGSAPSSHMHEVPSNAFLVDEYMGRGLAVVFMFDPFTRGLGELLFLNHAPSLVLTVGEIQLLGHPRDSNMGVLCCL